MVNYTIRYATNPTDFKKYDTQRIRDEFLVTDFMKKDEINLVYSMYDRYIVGGTIPVDKNVVLETIDPIKADHFLHRRELGIINVGNTGEVIVDEKSYELKYQEALYVGMGDKNVSFVSKDSSKPAIFYFNSAPAHKNYPDKHVTLADAQRINLGSLESSNDRTINKLIVNEIVETCQLQMGMTILKPGSVWNTMPPHVHSRRMEAYFYFEVPDDQAICHFMGQPHETRPIWMKNHDAVLSPSWSIHAAAGTSNYIFIWGMAGENLDYADMDKADIRDIR
ncbi:MAG: 5-dehydro-4-deoxy-D-glucuronate isomerase [Bacteroidota bacterium]